MLLDAGAEVVTGSAGKGPQPQRPVQFEGSAATPRAQQAQALAATAGGHQSKRKMKPQTAQSIRHFDDFAIFYTVRELTFGGQPIIVSQDSATAWWRHPAARRLTATPETVVVVEDFLVVGGLVNERRTERTK